VVASRGVGKRFLLLQAREDTQSKIRRLVRSRPAR
jgi:hypothetical protein